MQHWIEFYDMNGTLSWQKPYDPCTFPLILPNFSYMYLSVLQIFIPSNQKILSTPFLQCNCRMEFYVMFRRLSGTMACHVFKIISYIRILWFSGEHFEIHSQIIVSRIALIYINFFVCLINAYKTNFTVKMNIMWKALFLSLWCWKLILKHQLSCWATRAKGTIR